MNLKGIAPGTRLVTMTGDVVELLSLNPDDTAQVRYVEVEAASPATVGQETSMSVDDIITADGTRFLGPPRTASSSAP